MAPQPVFQLRIRLEGIDPPVWRRVLVPGGAKLSKLHDIFQAAMGWTNSHLHSFPIDDKRYGMQFDEYPEDEIDENEHTVLRRLRGTSAASSMTTTSATPGTHEVVVEDVDLVALRAQVRGVPRRREGLSPEDVGGTGGYEEFLEALADPLHEEHDDYLVWVGYNSTRGVQPGGGQRRPPEGALISPCPCASVAQPEALGAGLDDVGVEGQPVDDGRHQARIGDDLAPLAERQVGGGGHRGLLLPLGQDLEQQLRAAGVELDVAELVEHNRSRRP